LCGEGVPFAAVAAHKEDHCALRAVECSHRGCSKKLPLATLLQHECRKRTVYCLQGWVCGDKDEAEPFTKKNYCT
jgi:hypothetical protein